VPGHPNADLTAWTVPVTLLPVWDHTYVTSSCGFRWGCYGRDYGGHPLAMAPGNSIAANCLSQPNSWAGIRYGFTGVCHQMANRILYPAGLTVIGARGYGLTLGRYTAHGRGPWPEKAACLPPPLVISSSAGATIQTGDDPPIKGPATMTPASPESPPVDEFVAFAKATLGGDLDDKTAVALAIIQARLRIEADEMVARYDNGELSPEAYLEEHTVALRKAMKASEALLGRRRFLIVFGDAGDHPEGLIDRDKFLELEHENRRSR
jgi:hypothetical protein